MVKVFPMHSSASAGEERLEDANSDGAPLRSNDANDGAPPRNDANDGAPPRNDANDGAPPRNDANDGATPRNDANDGAPPRNDTNDGAPVPANDGAPPRNDTNDGAPVLVNDGAPSRNDTNDGAPFLVNDTNDGAPVPANDGAPPRNDTNDGAPVPANDGAPPRNDTNDGAPVPANDGAPPRNDTNDGAPVPANDGAPPRNDIVASSLDGRLGAHVSERLRRTIAFEEQRLRDDYERALKRLRRTYAESIDLDEDEASGRPAPSAPPVAHAGFVHSNNSLAVADNVGRDRSISRDEGHTPDRVDDMLVDSLSRADNFVNVVLANVGVAHDSVEDAVGDDALAPIRDRIRDHVADLFEDFNEAPQIGEDGSLDAQVTASLNPHTAKNYQVVEPILRAVMEAYVRKLSVDSGEAVDVQTHLLSNDVPPRPFWLVLAEACCMPRMSRPVDDVAGTRPLVAVPYGQASARSRFATACTSYKRRRPHIDWARNESYFVEGLRYIASPEIVAKYGLLPRRGRDTFATYDNLVVLNSAAFRPSATGVFKNARERLQIVAFASWIFFAAVRPGDICSDVGYPSNYTVQWRDVQFFVHLVDGRMTLGAIVTFRFLKGHKHDQNKFRRVMLNSMPYLPTCVDPVRLLAVLALMDGAICDVTDPAQLDVSRMSPSRLDPMTKRFELETNSDCSDLAVFRRIDQSGEASPWLTSETTRWSTGIANNAFVRLRNLSLPTLTPYSMRRFGVAILKLAGVSEDDIRRGIGQQAGSRALEAYLPTTQNFDLMGMAVEGRQNIASVQWFGIPLSDPSALRLTAGEEAEILRDARIVEARRIVDERHEIMTQNMTPMEARERRTPEYVAWERAASAYSTWISKVRKDRLEARNRRIAREHRASVLDEVLEAQDDDDDDDDNESVDLAEVDEILEELREAPATHPLAPENDVISRISDIVSSAPAHPDDAQWLRNLYARAVDKFDLHVPDFELLFAFKDEKASFASSYALLTNEHGTRFGESVHYHDACKHCGEEFAGRNLGDRRRHFHGCQEKRLKSFLQNALNARAKSSTCPIANCARRTFTSWGVLVNHVRSHRHSRICGFALPDGTPCPFEIGPHHCIESLDTMYLAIHREVSHGFADAADRDFFRDPVLDVYLVGRAAVELHCAARVPPVGDSVGSTHVHRPVRACPWCFLDPLLAPRFRLQDTNRIPTHCWTYHILPGAAKFTLDDEIVCCPCCNEVIATWDLFAHIHSVGVNFKKRRTRTDLPNLVGLCDPGRHAVERHIAFMDGLRAAKARHEAAGTSPLSDGRERRQAVLHSYVREPKINHGGGVRAAATQEAERPAESTESSDEYSSLSDTSSLTDSAADMSDHSPSEDSATNFDEAAYRPPRRRRSERS